MWDLPEESPSATKTRIENILATASPSVRRQSASRHDASIDVSIQKSILLLNESGTPGTRNLSGLRNMRLPNMTSFNQSMNASSFDKGDPSFSMTKDKTANRSNWNTSQLKASIQQIVDADRTDVTVYSAALLAESDPGFEATSGLFSDFLNMFLTLPSQYQVFELVQKYEECCFDQLQLLDKLIRLTPPNDNKFSRTNVVKNMLQGEHCTWRLIRTLYQDRIHTKAQHQSEDMSMRLRLSDQEIVENFYKKDSVTRHCQLVIDWLEQNVSENLTVEAQLGHFTDTSVPWENTLHFLNKQQTYPDFPSTKTIVTELDPDAAVRQRRQLHDLDREDDSRMFRLVFANIRGGALSRAQEITMKCGQPWLAAALEGWRLHHDPNYASESSDIIVDATGNASRGIWKSVCWNMAEDELLLLHERAIYAVYSGNLKLLLQACVSWEDYLWGYLRVMVDQRVEQELSDNLNDEDEMFPLPDAYWAKQLSMEQVFSEIEASQSHTVKTGSKSFYRTIQKYIILDDVDGLLQKMCDFVKENADKPSQHYKRFMAHLTLFLRSIRGYFIEDGKFRNEDPCIVILKSYIQDLIHEKKIDLISYYVATLPNEEEQVALYAEFLEGIKDKDEQQLCLKLSQKVNLDVAKITKTVVENIRNKEPSDITSTLHAKTTEDDITKIEAIDWLVFEESHRIEAIKQANALMRAFVASKKIEAANSVFLKIPSNSIDIIMKSSHEQNEETSIPADDENATREYLCFQAYLQAHDAFNEWFEHFNKSKPPKPEKLSHPTFTELISYEHHMKQYEGDIDHWNHTLFLKTKVVTDAMHNVLLFVDGGWMVDQRMDGTVDENRLLQMKLLRQICLPQITFLLHSVLHSTEQFKECIQLADVIASEHHRLHEVFNKEEMKLFLSKVRESSIEALDQKLDSLGYPIN